MPPKFSVSPWLATWRCSIQTRPQWSANSLPASAQRRTLEAEHAALLHQEAAHKAQRERIIELIEAGQMVAHNQEQFTYDQKRLALQAFEIEVKVFKRKSRSQVRSGTWAYFQGLDAIPYSS